MDLKAYYNQIDLAEIERFILDGQEENLNLEFKTVAHPNYNASNREDDKKNISKTLSGFANSNGGIIIWGIKAKENEKKQDVATDKKPIRELTKFLNILNRLEGQAITPVAPGIEHKKIEISDDYGFIVTFVPASDFAPHIANFANKHYYKRSGDSFYICEHYDIKDMFQRKHSAYLSLNLKDKQIRQIQNEKILIDMTLSLSNTGQNYAKAPLIKVEINKPYKFSDYGLDGNGNIGVFRGKSAPRTAQLSTYSGGQDILIYPDIEYNIDKIELEINSDVEVLPKLKVDYLIVAENMDKTKGTTEINVTK